MENRDKIRLLKALGKDPFNLKCWQCNENVSFENAFIVPSITKPGAARILCSSAICFAEYIRELERRKH